MNGTKILFEIVGGLSLLLYGIHLLGVNLQQVLGSKLEKILKKASNGKIKGLAIGTGITSIIQSGGTTTLMLIGFISAGILSLSDAVPVMLGANIGSTITTQLAAFRIGIYALPVLTVGFLIYIFSTRRIYSSFGQALMGLSFIFLGMSLVFSGILLLSFYPDVAYFISRISSFGIISVFIAAFFTFLLQSSSAASVFVVALGTAQIIDLNSALFLILGVNLGASAKVVYLALRGKRGLGKLALMHLMFNLLGIVIFLVFFKYFHYLVSITSSDIGRQIANAHTMYNAVNALIFLPFLPLMTKVVEKYIPARRTKRSKLSYLDRRLIYTPSVALNQVNRAVVEMAKIAYEMLEDSRAILFENKIDLAEKVNKGEQEIDKMTGKISEYTIQISQQNLDRKDSMKLYSLMHILTDIEHLSDHILVVSNLLVQSKKEKVSFSPKALRELEAVFGKLKILQNLVIKSLRENNPKLAYEIIKHENKVDEIVKKVHSNHLERLKKGECSWEGGKYFSELLNNLERIGDHSDNIAYAVVDRFR